MVLFMPAVTPSAFLPGYAFLASGAAAPEAGIFIPLNLLSNLTTAEAHPTTGDARKVVFEICRLSFTSFSTMDSSERPTRMTITRATPTGVDASKVRQAYTLSFDLDVSNADVAAET